MKFWWNGKKWVERQRRVSKGVQIMPDIREYKSPLGTGLITSRSHRREDLKRGNCREVDPGERLDILRKTEADAARERAELAARQPFQMSERARERLMRGY